jgi:uncharacterized membrane protein
MESAARSMAKSLSWRVVAMAITLSVTYAVTGNLRLAAAVGVTDTVIKIGTYYAHERAWNRVSFGKPREPEYYI